MFYHKYLDIVPCAVQQDPLTYLYFENKLSGSFNVKIIHRVLILISSCSVFIWLFRKIKKIYAARIISNFLETTNTSQYYLETSISNKNSI